MKRTGWIEFLLGISLWAVLPGSGIAEAGPLRSAARGVYCLTQSEGVQHVDLPSLDCWDNPNIVGVAIRATWAVIEPAPGQFDWSYLEEALRLAKSKKKLVAISIVAGIRSPDWVFGSATALRLTGKEAKNRDMVPAPWDPAYLSAWKKLVQTFGARYDGDPLVAYVTATGLGRGEECHLLDNPNDAGQFDANGWLAAANQIVDCYNSAFKITPWLLTWGQPAFRQNQLMAGLYKSGSGFGFKADNLFVFFPNPSVPVGRFFQRMSKTRPVVFQALRPARDPYTLAAVLENGRRMGMQAFECYQTDVNNPASQPVLAAANRAMAER
jgi:Beta-galactosidase